MKRGLHEPYSTHEQRVAWLLAHPQFLVAQPDLKALVKAMKRDKLLSESAYWSDVNLDVAISEAKRQRGTNLARR